MPRMLHFVEPVAGPLAVAHRQIETGPPVEKVVLRIP
jgi:hypothetical protein